MVAAHSVFTPSVRPTVAHSGGLHTLINIRTPNISNKALKARVTGAGEGANGVGTDGTLSTVTGLIILLSCILAFVIVSKEGPGEVGNTLNA